MAQNLGYHWERRRIDFLANKLGSGCMNLTIEPDHYLAGYGATSLSIK